MEGDAPLATNSSCLLCNHECAKNKNKQDPKGKGVNMMIYESKSKALYQYDFQTDLCVGILNSH